MVPGDQRSSITIDAVEVQGNAVRASVSATPDMRPLFSGEEFHVTYSVDVDDVPEHVLTVPVLAHVCPVAWFGNADVHVPTLDATFADALRGVNEALREMYPDLIGSGTIHCDRRVDGTAPGDRDGSALLFTGGVDSLFSYVRHRDEEPALISVNGWTISNDERDKWARKRAYLEGFGDDHGVDNRYVHSNMMTFYHHDVLRAHCAPHSDAVSGSWYTSVGHGLGMLGLCAPLAYAEGYGDLYIAASLWHGVSIKWGSCPQIDDRVRWSGTECHHDGHALSRQERIEVIAEYVRSEDPDLELRTCSSDQGRNCSACEKCYRTSLGLLLAGLDPNDHGYQFDSSTFDDVRTQLLEGNWWFDKNERIHWEELQRHATTEGSYPIDGSEAFFAWLADVDFAAVSDRFSVPFSDRLRNVVYRNLPYPMFNALAETSLYERVRESDDRATAPVPAFEETEGA